MAKWQFYVSRPSGNFWNPYETVEAGIFEGSLEEAQKELGERIRRTWSPYVTHTFEAAEHQMQPTFVRRAAFCKLKILMRLKKSANLEAADPSR